MANSLNLDLTGRVVILSADEYEGDEEARKFICQEGFGCKAETRGTKIFGRFLRDGEEAVVGGFDVERLAESAPVAGERPPLRVPLDGAIASLSESHRLEAILAALARRIMEEAAFHFRADNEQAGALLRNLADAVESARRNFEAGLVGVE